MGIQSIILKIILGGICSAIGLWGNFTEPIAFSLVIFGYLIIGGDVLLSAIQNIFRGNIFDENFLMSIATLGAFVIGEYFEAIVVMLFYQIGEAFQGYAVGKSRESITALTEIMPEFAIVKREGAEIKVDPKEVLVEEIIVVRVGERIPLDGILMEGEGTLDMKALTGESLPVEVTKGEEVLSGSINLNGVLQICVTKPHTESTVTKILALVEHATAKKSQSEKFITKFARYYTPVVVMLAVLLFAVPTVLGIGMWQDWLYRSISFLVVSCPCALVISIPLGFFGGIGAMARHGILVKGSHYIECLAQTDVILFDKTGTLTKGTFTIKEIKVSGTINEIEEADLWELTALAEQYSNHPIAKSIVEQYQLEFKEESEKKLSIDRLEQAEEIAGQGVCVVCDGASILVGNEKLMQGKGIACDMVSEVGSVVHVARDGVYLGYMVVADTLKEDSKTTITKLKERNIQKTILLTGDQEAPANRMGEELGLDEIHAKLLPEDKLNRAEQELALIAPKRKVAYVGDGINDAPVLARVDVGIAMGTMGAQAAIESADIVIMNDAPSKIVIAIDIAQKTLQIVKQNIILSFVVKGAVLLLASGGHSSLLEAIFADVGVAVLSILNAMRMIYWTNFEE